MHTKVTIQSSVDQCLGILMRRFMMEGMLEGQWEVVRFLVSMVPPLSPIFFLRTHFPNILYSTKRSLILHLLFDFFCVQSTTLFLITQPSLFESPLLALFSSSFFCSPASFLSASSQQYLQVQGPECHRDMCLTI